MAEAFAYENKPYTRETERFVRTFDKFFDLMNVRSLKEGVYKRKPNLKPYRNDAGSTERLQVATHSIFIPIIIMSSLLFIH